MIQTNEELGYKLIRSNECVICGEKCLGILLNYTGERERGKERGRKGKREGERKRRIEREREREGKERKERERERGGDEGGGRKEVLHSW